MKRLLTFIFLFLPIVAMADPIPESRARAVAGNFFKVKGLSSEIRLICMDPVQTKGTPIRDSYFIYNRDGGGFVIISADDAISPVLGWSDKGEFRTEGMPENIRGWMAMWDRINDALNDGSLKGDANAASEWADLSSGRESGRAGKSRQLVTAQWNQDSPFNYYCPSFGSAKTVTGCVATAAGIMMYYHKWPDMGTGTLPDYSYTDDEGERRTIKGFDLGHSYDWDNMAINVSESSPEDMKKAVGRLLYDVGVMVKSSYNAGGTGAYADDVYTGLAQYMKYDASAICLRRCYYSDSDWKEMLKNNLEDVGPVFYSASSEKQGGHAFVIDGYNEQSQFSINWGWGGVNNGFYTIPSFDDFVLSHSAIFNIMPDRGGTFTEELVIDTYDGSAGFTCSTDNFTPGEPFDVDCTYLFNMSSRKFDGELALVIEGRDGALREILGYDTFSVPPFNGYSIQIEDCIIKDNILIGDRLRLAYRSAYTPEWTFIKGNIEDNVPYFIPIADTRTLEESTSFCYTSETGVLIISSKNGIEWSITSSAGVSITEGVVCEEGVLTIDTTSFPLDTYVISLVKGYERKDISFIFGSK